jgi:CRP/FNR family cyclic AMP-dependent transcriptional regulator
LANEDRADFREFARGLGTVVSFPAAQVLFSEQDAPRHVYFILSGSVEISIRQKVIETIGAGQIVGLLSFVDEQPRTVTARTLEPCELALLDKKQFRYMVEAIPNFVWFVLRELAIRLRAANAAL